MSKFFFLLVCATALFGQERPILLKTATLIDGKGKILHNTMDVIEGSKIARTGGAAPANAVTYDLSAFTVSPGWIDTHTHLSYHFDGKDRYAGRDGNPLQDVTAASRAVIVMKAGKVYGNVARGSK